MFIVRFYGIFSGCMPTTSRPLKDGYLINVGAGRGDGS